MALAALLALPVAAEGAPPAVAQKPNYPNMPPKGVNATGLILITHGWMGKPAEWGDELKTKITPLLGGNANLWDIVVYDWEDIKVGTVQYGAATGYAAGPTPLLTSLKLADRARVNGQNIGRFLGLMIWGRGYEKIHFIGHSAGSWLNDEAADIVTALTFFFGGQQAVMQQTFLDTFMPIKFKDFEGVIDTLGDSATFAIQYVDCRELVQNKPFSNATLKFAYNLDITDVDPVPGRTFIGDGDTPGSHAWPHMWYRQTAANPIPAIAHGWGYNRSLEKGAMPAFGNTIDNRVVASNVRHALPAAANPCPPKQAPVKPAPAPVNFQGSQTSLTGTTITPPGTSFTLDADLAHMEPEAWIEQSVTVSGSEPANLLQFSYDFSGEGQGWLAVYVDGEVAFDADERYGNTYYDPPWAETIIVGNLSPGSHTIAFRLDPFSDDASFDTTSTVTVSDVRLSYADFDNPDDADDSENLCKGAKAKATGKKALALLKAFGKNGKTPNPGALTSNISKAQSKFTKGFTKAEFTSAGVSKGCEPIEDADEIEVKADSFVADVLDDLAFP